MTNIIDKFGNKINSGRLIISMLLILVFVNGVNLTTATSPDPKTSNIIFNSLNTSPDPYVHGKDPVKINYFVDTGNHSLDVDMKILNASKTKTIYSKKIAGVNFSGFNYILWNGKDDQSNVVPAGNYVVSLSISNNNPVITYGKLEKTFAVAAGKDTPAGASVDVGAVAVATTPAVVATQPSPDILKCSAESKFLYFENSEPAYDKFNVSCNLNIAAKVRAKIYNETYNPKTPDNSANEIKTVLFDTQKTASGFRLFWDGKDDNDLTAPLGNYNFVVEASINNSMLPDISIQKFKIDNAPLPASEVAPVVTGNAENIITPQNPTDTSLHSAADAVNSIVPIIDQQATVEVSATPSKCPGINYPGDIAGNEAEADIKLAYDRCLVQGYADGKFHPEGNLTRAEAVKIIVLAIGELAHKGCYTNDCGSPFKDLDSWQGAWVRAAWNLKIVSGLSPNSFMPNKGISRAEAAALVVKAKKITPYQGCYTSNCGAGYPDNLFRDIKLSWQGTYLRSLWDLKAIDTVEPFKFYPDRNITRADFIKLVFAVNRVVK